MSAKNVDRHNRFRQYYRRISEYHPKNRKNSTEQLLFRDCRNRNTVTASVWGVR